MYQKRMSRRDFIKTTALVASGTLLAACTPKSTPTASPTEMAIATATPVEVTATAAPKGPITLEYMSSNSDQTWPYVIAWQNAFKKYTGLHPNVVIKLNYLSRDDMRTQLMARAVSGKAPAFGMGGYWTSEMASNGSLADCTDLIASAGWKADDFWKAIWDITVFKGRQWGVPFTLDDRVWFYNADMYKQAGVNPPETWDDVLNVVGPAMREKGWYVWQPIGKSGDNWAWFTGSILVYSWGGEYIKEVDGLVKANCSGTAVEEAIDFNRQLLAKGVIPSSFPSDDSTISNSSFVGGKVASSETGPWRLSINDAAIKAGTMNFNPAMQLNPKKVVSGSSVGGWSWFITTASPDIQETFNVIKFMFEPDQMLAGWYASLPPRKQDVNLPAVQDPRYQWFWKQMDTAKWMMPTVAGWEEMSLIVWRHSMDAITGQKSTADAMKELDQELQPFLDAGENKLRKG